MLGIEIRLILLTLVALKNAVFIINLEIGVRDGSTCACRHHQMIKRIFSFEIPSPLHCSISICQPRLLPKDSSTYRLPSKFDEFYRSVAAPTTSAVLLLFSPLGKSWFPSQPRVWNTVDGGNGC